MGRDEKGGKKGNLELDFELGCEQGFKCFLNQVYLFYLYWVDDGERLSGLRREVICFGYQVVV